MNIYIDLIIPDKYDVFQSGICSYETQSVKNIFIHRSRRHFGFHSWPRFHWFENVTCPNNGLNEDLFPVKFCCM